MLIDVGLLSRRGIRSEKDAGAIEMMRKAGAIPLAITNVSEMAMWWESNNKVRMHFQNLAKETAHQTSQKQIGVRAENFCRGI